MLTVSVVESQDENGNFTYGKTIGTQTISDWFGRNEAVTVMTKDPVDTVTTDFASISSQYNYVTNDNVTTNLLSSVRVTQGTVPCVKQKHGKHTEPSPVHIY